jgi:hypothetical protein
MNHQKKIKREKAIQKSRDRDIDIGVADDPLHRRTSSTSRSTSPSVVIPSCLARAAIST